MKNVLSNVAKFIWSARVAVCLAYVVAAAAATVVVWLNVGVAAHNGGPLIWHSRITISRALALALSTN